MPILGFNYDWAAFESAASGHKLHRTIAKEDQQTADLIPTSTSYVTLEACDCN